jgi:hypothetical protein
VIAALRQTAAAEGREIVAIGEKIKGELRAVMSNYFAHVVGHRLRMSDYLKA